VQPEESVEGEISEVFAGVVFFNVYLFVNLMFIVIFVKENRVKEHGTNLWT